MALQFDDILLSIKSDAKGTLGTITKLTNALSGLQQTLDPSKINGISTGLRALNGVAKGLSEKHVRRYERLSNALREISRTSAGKRALKNLDTPQKTNAPREAKPTTDGQNPLSNLTSYQKQFMGWADIFGGIIRRVTEGVGNFSSSLNDAFKNTASGVFNQVPKAFGEMAETLPLIGVAINPFVKGLGALGSVVLKAVSAGIGKVVDKLNAFRKGLQRIGRIASLMMLRKAINAVVKGLQEGWQNLVAWDRVSGLGDIARNADLATASLTAMKNATAVIVAPFVEPLVSGLKQIAIWAMQASNALANFFATIMGKATFTAVKFPQSIADGMASAGGATKKASKELKSYLMGFDELNVIDPTERDGSGGGGGASNAIAGLNDMFETVDTKMGELGELFTSGKFDKFGKALGDMVNGWVNKIDANAIGQRIGKVIRDAFSIAYNFLTTVDFNNIGTKIGNFLTGIIQPLDGETIGRTLFRGISSGVDMLIGFIGGTDWSTVGTQFGQTVLGWLDAGIEWFDTNWDTALGDIETALNDFIKAVPWKDIAGKAWELFKKALQGLGNLTDLFIEAVFQDNTSDDRGTILTGGRDTRGHVWGGRATKEEKGIIVSDGRGHMSWYVPNKQTATNSGRQTATYYANGYESTTKTSQTRVSEWIKKCYEETGTDSGNSFADGTTRGLGTVASKFIGLGGQVDAYSGKVSGVSENFNALGTSATNASTNVEKITTSINSIPSDTINNRITVPLTGAKDSAKNVKERLDAIKQKIAEFTATTFKNLKDPLKSASDYATNIESKLTGLNGKNYKVSVSQKVTIEADSIDFKVNGQTYSAKWDPNSQSYKQKFASGGFVQTGQEFIAREAGPELVGTIGNQTAVMNNDQIVEAVSQGVARAVSSVLGGGFGQNDGASYNLYLDGKQILTSVKETQTALGANIMSGNINYAY